MPWILRFALLTAFLKYDRASFWASQSSCFVLMAFLQAWRASFRRLASSEFHQMVSFLRSDFRIGQAASYDLVITEWTLFASTSMSSFEEGTGGKIRSLNFCWSSSTYLFRPVRRTFWNTSKHFSLVLDSALNLEPGPQRENFSGGTKQWWSRGHKARGQGQGHKKKSKAKDSLSKDRPSRGQGQECSRPRPRTQPQVFSKRKKMIF